MIDANYGAPYGLVNSIVLPVRAEEGRRRTMYGWEEIGLIKDRCDNIVAEVENLFVATEIAAIINVHDELLRKTSEEHIRNRTIEAEGGRVY